MSAVKKNEITLSQQLGSALKEKQYILTLAESCTGGGLAACITDIAGSSAWFDRGFVTYTNEAKVEMLGVQQAILDALGAVSEETAKAMADGALLHSHADIALSITGIAGPDGGSPEKPVGTVCFGLASKQSETQTTTQHFEGDREAVRAAARLFALEWLLKKFL